MRRKDASFQVAAAGARAMRKAREEGAPPEAVDALMDTGPLKIAGITLRPLCLPVIWALGSTGSAVMSATEGEQPEQLDAQAMALAIACFVDPVGMHMMARRKDTEGIDARCMEIVEKVGLEEMQQINLWMENQFARSKKLSGADIQEGSTAAPAVEKKPGEAAHPPL